jgi:general secretion pathway protein D
MWVIALGAPFAFAQQGASSAAAPAPTTPAAPAAGGAFQNRGIGRGLGRTTASPAAGGPTVGGAAAGAGGAGTTPTTPPTTAAGAGGATAGATPAAGGKQSADTDKLPQFETGVEFEPRGPNYKVAFSLEDADLNELVRVIAQLTGKRFIFGGKVRNIKTSVYSPQKVTVAEAYQAFLSILETNGLTVIPQGRFLKIVETGAIASETTPIYGPNQPEPAEDRFVTRMLRLKAGNADELAGVLAKFKSKEGAVEAYAPGNLLIITDTGAQIHRMQTIIDQIDVGGSGDQIWIEPIHYAAASDVQKRIDELFDIKSGSSSTPAAGGKGGPSPSGAGGGDLHVTKIIADDRTNSLLIVATEKAYLRMLEIIKRMDVPQSEGGEIHVLPLQHADAVELTKTLGEIVTGANAVAKQGDPSRGGTAGGAATGTAAAAGIFEGGVKVSADKATNSLVVTSSLRDYAALHAVVDRLDQARRQVFIEAVIMDLSITRSNQLGVNFHAGDTFGSSNGDGLVYGGLNPLKTILLPDPTSLQGMALGVRGPGIPGSENLLGTGLSIPAFGVVVNALASSTDADVLSTPHILATDNIVAEINVGENIPLQTNLGFPSLGGAGAGGAAAGALGALGSLGGGFGGSGARQDVGTKIKITPHLNDSNEVRLELAEEISEAQAPQGNAGVVPITKRTANTQLTVGDQQTVVIGGLMRNRVTHSQQKIPLLGDIPVLGALFRSTQNDMQKTNLILILTPYIIREQTDLRTIFERKMQERQEFLDRYFIFSDDQEYSPPKDYSRTNGLMEVIRQAYLDAEEKKRLEELTGPRPMVGHEPTDPIQMPTTPRSSAASSAGASTGGTPAPAPTSSAANGNGGAPLVQTSIPPRSVNPGVKEVEH